MFFITRQKDEVPDPTMILGDDDTSEPSRKRKHVTDVHDSGVSGYYPKRVQKACDRCRLKKVKCTGGQVCERCKTDAVVCITSADSAKASKPVNPEYLRLVELQRDQLVQALAQILRNQDEPAKSKLRSVLTELGISADSFPTPPENPDFVSETDVAAFNEMSPGTWADLFSIINGDEANAPNSFPADRPYSQDEMIPSDGLPDQFNQTALLATDFPPSEVFPSYDDMHVWNPDTNSSKLPQWTTLQDVPFDDHEFLAP